MDSKACSGLTTFRCGNAMTREADMVCFSLDEADEDIISTIRESGLSRYPVYDEDINDIIGILNARDYLLDRKKLTARQG